MDPDRVQDLVSRGSYETEGEKFLPIAAKITREAELERGDQVLDVGCGTGNVAVTASSYTSDVVASDVASKMTAETRKNANVANLDIEVQKATATRLPYRNGTFDVTLSGHAHMYAMPQERAGRELVGVTKAGGTVVFSSWTPTSVYTAMSGVFIDYLPEGYMEGESPYNWGSPSFVKEVLGDRVEEIEFETEKLQYPVMSPRHFWHHKTTRSGVFIEVKELIDEKHRPEVAGKVAEALEPYFDRETSCMELEYLVTKITV
ncbi:MAG: class I SAM-dependent methyltransferase [Halobacteria archaeon]